jgi:hypothetical protein
MVVPVLFLPTLRQIWLALTTTPLTGSSERGCGRRSPRATGYSEGQAQTPTSQCRCGGTRMMISAASFWLPTPPRTPKTPRRADGPSRRPVPRHVVNMCWLLLSNEGVEFAGWPWAGDPIRSFRKFLPPHFALQWLGRLRLFGHIQKPLGTADSN